MGENVGDPQVRSHSVLRTVVLSLLPGLLVLIFFTTLGRYSDRLGVPSMFFITLGIFLILVPFELGVLFREGKRLNGRLSLRDVVLYQKHVPTRQLATFVALLTGWEILTFGVVAPRLDPLFTERFFYWVPKWFFIEGFLQDVGRYSRTALLGTWALYLILNGVVAPIVEELYFRGYLLPRQRPASAWAPVVHLVLFSLQHFMTPWQNPTRIVALLPFVYVVWWKKDIRIGIGAHCLTNTIGAIAQLFVILR